VQARFIFLLVGISALAACAGPEKPSAEALPAWFVERTRQLETADYPDLAEVPKATPLTRSAAEYNALERGLWNERATIEASARAEDPPAPAVAQQQADAFVRGARDRIENTRPPEETAPPAPPPPN
jgi:hypothetical protein